MIELIDGSVRKEDALEIRDMMRSELEKGNRFVTFLSGKEGLTREDFTAFRSSFEAHEHAHENTTDYDIYAVRATAGIEKDMTRLLEMEKDCGQDKPSENQREEKHSRGAELSR